MTPPYFIVWSQGPALGPWPAGSVHLHRSDAERVARGRRGALSFTHGPEGPDTWRVWIAEVLTAREVA